MSHPAFENQNGHSAAYLAELAREFHEAPDAPEPYFRGPEIEFDDWDEVRNLVADLGRNPMIRRQAS